MVTFPNDFIDVETPESCILEGLCGSILGHCVRMEKYYAKSSYKYFILCQFFFTYLQLYGSI